MAFYASITKGSQATLAVGPFRRHGDAMRASDAFREYLARIDHSQRHWIGYGTARHRRGHAPGRFNDQVGVELDASGFVIPASIPSASRWVDVPDLNRGAYTGRRGGDPRRVGHYRRRAACNGPALPPAPSTTE